MMEKNPNIKELISAYYDGETTPEETVLVEKHLQEFPECQKYFESLGKLSSSLKTWQKEDLSPDLTQKMAQSLYGSTIKEGREMERKQLFSRLTPAIACVAIIGIVLVGANQFTKLAKRGARGRLQVAKSKDGGLTWSDVASTAQPSGGVSGQAVDKNQIAFKGQQAYEPYYLKRKSPPEKIARGNEVATTNTAQTHVRRSLSADESRRAYGIAKVARPPVMYEQQTVRYKAEGKGFVSGSAMSRPFGIPAEDYDPYSQPRIDRYGAQFHTEEYDRIYENEFLDANQNPLSTFSIDVDTASYSNVRRFLNNNQLPPKDSVRIEELINYFSYDYPLPTGEEPFTVTTEVAVCPWNQDHHLALIGLQGKTLQANAIPPSNLVFLLDVSGSMNQRNKLPLLKDAFKLLVNSLRDEDTVSIVVYAGSAGMVLEPTPGSQKSTILAAIDRLNAGGSTAGGQGIRLAYETAKRHFIQEGNNRVILATDGDFNVGLSSDAELVRMIEERRDQGIFLTVLGFGMGNYKDSKMEKLADKGNGNYAYIDTIQEARKVLVNELGTMLFTIAKDVKLQIEFNPNQVKSYRLIGYENRMLAKEDFNDDTKDAGELGAGHTVTAIYELIPADAEEVHGTVDPLKYQKVTVEESNDLMTIKLRYKEPKETVSKLITNVVPASLLGNKRYNYNLEFASAVAEFGLLLRNSKYKANANFTSVLDRARKAKGSDHWGYRAEFINLVEKAKSLSAHVTTPGIIMFKGGDQVY